MRPSQILLQTAEKSEQVPTYVCAEPNCLVRYDSSSGYLVIAADGSHLRGELTPKVACPKDSALMYLAEVNPEQKSYRLWRCPKCGTSLTNQELSQASNA